MARKPAQISTFTLAFGLAISPVLADNPVTDAIGGAVKGVVNVTEKVVKGTAKGAEIVVKDAAKGAKIGGEAVFHGTEVVVKDAAKGAKIGGEAVFHGTEVVVKDVAKGAVIGGEAVVKGGEAVVKGTEAAVSATGRAVGHAVGSGKDALPKPQTSINANAQPQTTAPPVSLIGTSLGVTVDGAGNIVDTSGKLVGRVNENSTDKPGSASLAGQTMTVTVNQAGQMLDAGGNAIGHVLGASPEVSSGATVQPGVSWSEEDAMRESAGALHGPIEKGRGEAK